MDRPNDRIRCPLCLGYGVIPLMRLVYTPVTAPIVTVSGPRSVLILKSPLKRFQVGLTSKIPRRKRHHDFKGNQKEIKKNQNSVA
jgi:hypothetical protein